MERTFKVTVILNRVMAEGDDEDSLKESIKEALLAAVEADDRDESELEFVAEEIDAE